MLELSDRQIASEKLLTGHCLSLSERNISSRLSPMQGTPMISNHSGVVTRPYPPETFFQVALLPVSLLMFGWSSTSSVHCRFGVVSLCGADTRSSWLCSTISECHTYDS
ncbi:hypothetical protein LIPSTDRAFT_229567 [Lipomyces starkeyi NRRL Y-11557]|uniref:Uncharacterized protein n=1 Tax=Lipomyces starkeyi NRRL Y-11557 TaxID=675824 RepID=A0A1E3QAT0_LIPST|nr:hypothetical protein LIPSTDRAFT_229567 [Lipomyces starkeyi NRRL Y-11557]